MMKMITIQGSGAMTNKVRTIIINTGRTKTGWEELHGHGCETTEEMMAYVLRFSQLLRDFHDMPISLEIADAPYDNGGYIANE